MSANRSTQTQALNLAAGVSNCKVSRGRSFSPSNDYSIAERTARRIAIGDAKRLLQQYPSMN